MYLYGGPCVTGLITIELAVGKSLWCLFLQKPSYCLIFIPLKKQKKLLFFFSISTRQTVFFWPLILALPI